MGARIAAFLALNHPNRVASLVFGGLGINMVRGMAGTGPIAHALEAASIDDVKNQAARTFRAFAEQTKSDLKALAACIRSARDPITAEALGRLTCPVLVAVGETDVVGGSGPDLARAHSRGAGVRHRRPRSHEGGRRPHLQRGGVRIPRGSGVKAGASGCGAQKKGPGNTMRFSSRDHRGGCRSRSGVATPGPRHKNKIDRTQVTGSKRSTLRLALRPGLSRERCSGPSRSRCGTVRTRSK